MMGKDPLIAVEKRTKEEWRSCAVFWENDSNKNQEQITKLQKANAIYREALDSIGKNTCCDECQEARLVANKALSQVKEME